MVVSCRSHGFEDRVGQECTTDRDCEHASYHEDTVLTRLHGGKCKSGKCVCTACAAGDECKIVKQWQSGKGNYAYTAFGLGNGDVSIDNKIEGIQTLSKNNDRA